MVKDFTVSNHLSSLRLEFTRFSVESPEASQSSLKVPYCRINSFIANCLIEYVNLPEILALTKLNNPS